MNDKIIAELREWAVKHGLDVEPEIEDMAVAYSEFEAILSRLEAEQGADKGEQGLRVKLLTIANDGCGCECCEITRKELNEVVDTLPAPKHEAVEPLACLVDKKGYWLNVNHHNNIWRVYGSKVDWVSVKVGEWSFEAPTYAAAEAKARAYLMGLPDAKGGV